MLDIPEYGGPGDEPIKAAVHQSAPAIRWVGVSFVWIGTRKLTAGIRAGIRAGINR